MRIDIREEGELVDSVHNIADFTAGIAEHCNYMVHDEMIRYRIIVGLRDSNLSERLQIYPELNLDI